ncbi:uncharacterized protein EAF02_006167 [Botrytis sinoallii]|uniref:uncharacterized protein n=1 Tax=Botrytis sinoallii TaxID=1463999 RepID=UPI0018FF1FEF|nr:uncharacterized protein EAF02_006167 [Botrytis sinoallii]KAF7882804.1 hypothetical protein EAF02_006167 [Botrytis sinoallii]
MSQPPDSKEQPPRRFFGYPKPVEGPEIPFNMPVEVNPVQSGIALVILGWIVSKFDFVQKFIYNNAGFTVLRDLDLGNAIERMNPLVIPLANDSEAPYVPDFDRSSFQDFPGRYHTVADYHEKYLSGELTPLAVCKSLLPLIRRDIATPSHHAISFIATNVESVLDAAEKSTARYAAGKPLGLLDGIPSAIKDATHIAGYRTTNGRAANDELFPISETSDWPIQKLEECGVIILGKTNMYEYGTDTTGLNPYWGTPRNPHNRNYYTGGSSSGSAYAVAAGLVPFTFGADGGGSIRIPAAFCGIYGLKPTYGRLEDTSSTVVVTGPLASSMMDLEAMYRVLAQPDPSDSICQSFAPPSKILTSSLQPKIIGIYKPWFERSDASVLEMCQKAIDYYENHLGYEVVDIELPYIPEGQKAHVSTILAELAIRARSNHLPDQKPTSTSWLADLNPANKIALGVGSQMTAQDYLLAQQMRNILMQHLAFLFEMYPGLLIVTPTCPMPGWDIKSEKDLKYGFTNGNLTFRSVEYVWIANLCGNPAISVPVGYVDPVETAGEGKVPIGLMAMSDWGSEDQLLGWGREAEIYLNHVYEGGRKRPNGDGWVDVFELASSQMETVS